LFLIPDHETETGKSKEKKIEKKDFNGCAIQIFEWSKIDKLIVVEYQEQYFSNIFDKNKIK
jgi:hypothetical protein